MLTSIVIHWTASYQTVSLLLWVVAADICHEQDLRYIIFRTLKYVPSGKGDTCVCLCLCVFIVFTLFYFPHLPVHWNTPLAILSRFKYMAILNIKLTGIRLISSLHLDDLCIYLYLIVRVYVCISVTISKVRHCSMVGSVWGVTQGKACIAEEDLR